MQRPAVTVRAIGIDPGTVSIDLCGVEDGRLFLDQTIPTADAVADPLAFVEVVRAAGSVDCIAGPSGYGLPLTRGADLTETDLRLAFLTAPGETGGIGGLGALARALAASGLPIVFTPGVVHLSTVPAYRKVNRVDLGTAEKVCAAALAVAEQATRRGCALGDVSLILLELGGAFTAGIAVDHGQIVDGVGGTSGPMGLRAAGALDGEVAFLAGRIDKAMLFTGGVMSLPAALGHDAYVEGACKAVAALAVSVPRPFEIVLSGRGAADDAMQRAIAERLAAVAPIRRVAGFARIAKHGAQGAALIADGPAGGRHAALVETLALREARGTVLDHLSVITPEAARRRLGLT